MVLSLDPAVVKQATHAYFFWLILQIWFGPQEGVADKWRAQMNLMGKAVRQCEPGMRLFRSEFKNLGEGSDGLRRPWQIIHSDLFEHGLCIWPLTDPGFSGFMY